MMTHVFVVNTTTFKYHLEYQFVGTGCKDSAIDLNNCPQNLHYKTESNLFSMFADFARVKVGDLVIFYLQQEGNNDGKFYGVFKITSLVSLDNNDGQQFLRGELKKSLTFRCLIEPFEVYPYGVTEWEALDEIQYIHLPNQMLWSLIYRKLKGNRGNTMITMFESERLIGLIRAKNQGRFLIGQNFSFDSNSQIIIPCEMSYPYIGRRESINILPRLIQKYRQGNQFEAHLQAYILQNFTDFCKQIRILDGTQNHVPLHIFNPNGMCGLSIQPMIICRQIDKKSKYYQDFEQECVMFNQNNHILPISYVEFNIDNDSISFERIL